MSLFRKIKKGLKKVVKGSKKIADVAARVSDPAAYAMQMSYSGASARQQFAAPPQYSDYGSGMGGQGMSMIRTGGLPARLGQMSRLGGRIGTRLPGPVGKTIGGLVVIGGWLYDQMGNRVGKAPTRHRAKGITARELKGFTRVTHILDKYCKMKPPGGARRTTHRATRSKTCR
jgi:hypothetical protein